MKKLIVVLVLLGGCAAHVGNDTMLEGLDGGDDGSSVSLLPLGPDGKPILPDGGEIDVDGSEPAVQPDGDVPDVDGGAGSGSTDGDAGPQADAGADSGAGSAGTDGSDPDAGVVKLNACGGTEVIYCPSPWEGSLESNPSKHASCSPTQICAGLVFAGNGICPAQCQVVKNELTYWRCDSQNTITCDACDCSAH